MNKAEFINAVHEEMGGTHIAASRAVNAVLDTLGKNLAHGHDVVFQGFGTFTVKESAAKMGRNPSTGAPLPIAAKKRASFKAGKNLQDRLN